MIRRAKKEVLRGENKKVVRRVKKEVVRGERAGRIGDPTIVGLIGVAINGTRRNQFLSLTF